jgi:hypothetical protein
MAAVQLPPEGPPATQTPGRLWEGAILCGLPCGHRRPQSRRCQSASTARTIGELKSILDRSEGGKSEAVNRAISVYAFTEGLKADNRTLMIRDPDGTLYQVEIV